MTMRKNLSTLSRLSHKYIHLWSLLIFAITTLNSLKFDPSMHIGYGKKVF